MSEETADERLDAQMRSVGLATDEQWRPGANYDLCVESGGQLYLSGQIPRIAGVLSVAGTVGADVNLEDARRAAAICVLRSLAIARSRLRTLARVRAVPRMTVFVQSAPDFSMQSEVADAASDILYAVLRKAGAHARTSVGVYRLPKNAAVELDLIVAVE